MFEKILPEDLEGRGVIGLPDTPGLSTPEMQAKFEETAREVIVPAFNALVDALAKADGNTGAANVGAFDADGNPTTMQAHITERGNPHRVTAKEVGTLTTQEIKKLIDDAAFASGGGDMYRAMYDPQARETDIFDYVDRSIKDAITDALNGGV